MKNYFEGFRQMINWEQELLWAQIWHDTIKGISWLENREGMSPGRWAVGYNYLYVMTRILDGISPLMVLDIGLGVSTRLISQYFDAKGDESAKHMIVEHDKKWIEFYLKNNQLSPYSSIYVEKLVHKKIRGKSYPAYKDISKDIKDTKFNVISIDAPYGGDAWSRRDILDVLPKALADSFVIVIDDANRKGEKRTVSAIENILKANKTQYKSRNYKSLSDCYVIASADNRFLCTL